MSTASSRIPLAAAALTALLCIGFSFYTAHMWEDYLITFRSSLNLINGHGLVYQSGERVHSFTSPLGTLLPALFSIGDVTNVAERALWGYRVVCIAALAGALWLAVKELQRSAISRPAILTACGLWMFDAKIVDFSINGMESALLIFFGVLSWRTLARGASPLACAVCVAGLQLTRPDGFIIFGALGFAWWFLGAAKEKHQSRTARLWPVIQGGLLGVLLYVPWLGFAWWYYGSPIPHTIIAKQMQLGLAPGELATTLMLYPWRLLFGHCALHDIFRPAYFYMGGWPAVVRVASQVLAVGAALGWCLPFLKPAGRLASLAFFLGGFYLEYIPRSPWYYPVWQVLACLSWGYLLDALSEKQPGQSWWMRLLAATSRITAATLVLIQAALLISVAVQMREQQNLIENHHRREIGLWLKSEAAVGDRVYLEPLGYIGYYSGLKMLDNPGLASPEVVAAQRAGFHRHAEIIDRLKPEWLVLRPDQVSTILEEKPALLSDSYQLAKVFDARPGVVNMKFLPGRDYLQFDAFFYVFSRSKTVDSNREGKLR